jgi:hypothetical protein
MQTVAERIKRSTKSERPKKDDPNQKTLDMLSKWQAESNDMKSTYEARWAKNLKLSAGMPTIAESTTSRVRQRDKQYFRKIWATKKRLVASLYAAFLQDYDNVKIEGRDKLNDFFRAGVLQEMVNYRKDQLINTKYLILKHTIAFEDILDYGWCVGKLAWDFDPKGGIDEPDYVIWPPEQCYPDMSAETPDKMKYIIFESYLNKEQLEEKGFQNIDECEKVSIPYNDVRAVRHNIHKDPLQNTGEKDYPSPGHGMGDRVDEQVRELFRVWECFWKEGAEIKFCVTNGDKVFLRNPRSNPYKKILPAVIGFCLTVPHRLIGEGLAEPLEGPQESYNYNLNIRKDNVALCLNAPTIVNRFANVDLGSLVNVRAGGVVLADDSSENAVRKLQMGDVTQSSYGEASADDFMMQEMSGITAGKQGMERSDKATVAQINYQEGNEKIAYFVALVGETYWRSFNYQLAYMVQNFETDEKVIRIANSSFQQKEEAPFMPYIDMVDDFDADIKITLGPQAAGRNQEIQNTMLLMDRSVMYNQQLMGLLQAGVLKADDAKFLNISALAEDLLPALGKRSQQRYFIAAQPPPPQEGTGGNGGIEGRNTPQIGATDINAQANPFDLKVQGTPNLPAPT